MNTSGIVRCSFCKKTRSDVEKMVAGHDSSFICSHCISLCFNIIDSDKSQGASVNMQVHEDILLSINPSKIVKHLDEYVIGQSDAKKLVAVAVYNHFKRLRLNSDVESVEFSDTKISKSNILLWGPTGCGKTLIARTLADFLNVPFVVVDATSLTQSGYVGDDPENILLKLLHAAGYDLELAQRGIICIDEIDKIARKSDSASITRDVSGEGVQQALLKIIEGTIVAIPPQGGRKHPQQECIQMDTTNVLFICCGAFIGLQDIIKNRIKGSSIGFSIVEGTDSSALLKRVQPDDLIKYGLIPEFVGRLPVMSLLEDLDVDSLLKVLSEPKDAIIKQYKALFGMDGVDLSFETEALRFIAEQVKKQKMGARGLRSLMELVLLELMYTIPDENYKDKTKMKIDKDFVEKRIYG